jgi:hypothetical protein
VGLRVSNPEPSGFSTLHKDHFATQGAGGKGV